MERNSHLISNFVPVSFDMRSARSLQYPSKRSLPVKGGSPRSGRRSIMYGSSIMVVITYVRLLEKGGNNYGK